MKEFFQSIMDNAKERLKSPFIGSYCLSFIIYNWKPFSIYFFSNSIIEDKVEIISKNYSESTTFLIPLMMSIFYILILPYINLAVYWIVGFSNNEAKKRIRTLNIESLEQKVVEAQLERKIADRRAGTNEIDLLQSKITSLEQEIQLKAGEINMNLTRHNNEISTMQSEYTKIYQENQNLEKNYVKIESESKNIEEIYKLFLNETETADREIKKFLRKHLQNNEIHIMKKNLKENFSFKDLPFRSEVNSLLIKIFAYEYDQKTDSFMLSDYGKKFIEDID